MKCNYLNIILISSAWELSHRKRLHIELSKELKGWSEVVFVEYPFSIIAHTFYKFKDRFPKLLKDKPYKSNEGVNLLMPVIIFHTKIWKMFKFTLRIDSFLLKLQIKNIIKKKYPDSKIIVWMYDPFNYELYQQLKPDFSVYDYYDNFEYDVNGKLNKTRYEMNCNIIKNSNLVFCTAKVMYNKAVSLNKNSYYLPNGHGFTYEKLKFIKSKINNPDSEFVIGYIGNIRDWIDFDLIGKLVDNLKINQRVVFIGPVEKNVRANISELKLKPGFTHINNVPYEKVEDYLKNFDVGIIPFKKNKFTEGVLPYKLFEYLAYRIQTVSTDLPDLKNYENFINIAVNDDEFLELCLNNFRHRKEMTEGEHKEFIINNSWDKRSNFMNQKIKEVIYVL